MLSISVFSEIKPIWQSITEKSPFSKLLSSVDEVQHTVKKMLADDQVWVHSSNGVFDQSLSKFCLLTESFKFH